MPEKTEELIERFFYQLIVQRGKMAEAAYLYELRALFEKIRTAKE